MHHADGRNLDALEVSDRGDEPVDQIAGRRFVAVEEHLYVRAGREVVALCADEDRPGAAFSRLPCRRGEIPQQLRPEQVEGRIGDHDLADGSSELERCFWHQNSLLFEDREGHQSPFASIINGRCEGVSSEDVGPAGGSVDPEARRELDEISAALARREGMLSQAETISGIGSWEWVPDTDELHWSDQMFRIFGVDQDSFTPTPDEVRALYHPDDRDYVRTLMDTAVATGREFRFEYRIVQRSGDVRVLEAAGRTQIGEDSGSLRLFGVVQDITERKETEKVLADAFSRERIARVGVERANAELESFVYTVSHDLNGPVISILGYIELFETDFGATLPDEAKFYLERIKVSGNLMQSLITDLLELSRVGRVQTEPHPVDLGALFAEIADEIRAEAPAAAVRVDGDLPDIHMHPERAKQLFTKLIQNSVRHSERPDVTVDVRMMGNANGLVTLSLSDNGPGIPIEKRERVFRVFERLDAVHPGTGMGLAVCKRIVETNGGEIWIAESESGTDMRMSIPVAPGTDGATV